MSRRAHWSFSEYDVFPARITEVGSESDEAGIPHGWQQLVIRTLGGGYADDSVGMYGTVDFNSAYKMDGSAASVGDIVYVRVRGMSETRGVIFDILDSMVGLRGDGGGSESSGFRVGGLSGGDSEVSGPVIDPYFSFGQSGVSGSIFDFHSGQGSWGLAGSRLSGAGVLGSNGDCGCGCGGSGGCGGGCDCKSKGKGISGELMSSFSFGSTGFLFGDSLGGDFLLVGRLGLGLGVPYASSFDAPFEFYGDLSFWNLMDLVGSVSTGWWSLGSIYDYLESTPLDDYAPGSARFLLLESDGSGVKTITGLSMGQVDSQEVWIKNIGSVDNIVLSWEHSGSAAPNRFSNSPSIGSDVIVPGASVLYKYSASLSRWVKMR